MELLKGCPVLWTIVSLLFPMPIDWSAVGCSGVCECVCIYAGYNYVSLKFLDWEGEGEGGEESKALKALEYITDPWRKFLNFTDYEMIVVVKLSVHYDLWSIAM